MATNALLFGERWKWNFIVSDLVKIQPLLCYATCDGFYMANHGVKVESRKIPIDGVR